MGKIYSGSSYEFLSLKEARKMGSITYFNGKSCVHGHPGLRYTSCQKCVHCARERHREAQENRKSLGMNRESKTAKSRDFSALTTEQKALLVALSLGDGHIRIQSEADRKAGRRIASQLTFAHGISQKPYLEWKIDQLNSYFGGHATVGEGLTSASGGRKKYRKCHSAKSHPALFQLHSHLYGSGRKIITRELLDLLDPQGVAIWFMDDGSSRANRAKDGSISSVRATFATQCQTKVEAQVLADYFQEVWGVNMILSRLNKTGRWDISTGNSDDALLFFFIVEPHIIRGMVYKLKLFHDYLKRTKLPKNKRCSYCSELVTHYVRSRDKVCKNCYNKLHSKKRAKELRCCSICGMTLSGKWFVGSRCRICYVKQKNGGI
jgi:LAGLIDADG DNA endonuclease family